ncbi:alpha-1,2-mannosyltransferase [Cladophialophora yegresii CBS 114405]|uniref:Mannosyltransferase n=1 Tax=Cladophialophora yegresii CBS 114405 TaxID=1182544 RepID=W9WFG1_9EURO|nr:alpha-1,2-mannosyltransferase [Cladophialophora yegresii CBS 114405]EXJ57264.1 alpha-1,2-mannosyltransferase [Cladophialophora yegresii CBS 114405]
MDPSLEDFKRRTDPIKLPRGAKGQPTPQPAPTTFYLPLDIAFYLCLASHILGALYAPIQDCDETFNYWEPLHYLTHGYGLQTWEYSPGFSIRSWAYIALHAVPIKVVSFLGRSKTFEFFALRVMLALVCAATEVRLYSTISRTINPRVGVIYLTIVAFTPGFFYASSAFLPSSFAMYTSTLGLTAFMNWHGGTKTAVGIMWFGVGALLGWPFSGALIVPFVVEDWLIALVGQSNLFEAARRYLDGVVRCLVVLALQVSIDTFFYHKVTVVPWRIVAYNIFGGKDRGPDIFGTEPWHYYIRNLLLNFNIWFVLAAISAPLYLFQAIILRQHTTKQSILRTLTFLSPFYLWLGVFTLQPHKEERFMFPAYPFLALNAAIAFHSLLAWIGSTDSVIFGKIPPKAKLAVILPVVLLSINAGLLRIVGTVTAYRAPLQIYDVLGTSNMTHHADTVCFGKDWYRFPSSHFLPNGVHAKFIKSEFDGLLPGEFHEGKTGFGFFAGTWLIPPGMNDRNEEDPGKYIDVQFCTFLVDSYMPGMEATEHEPLYIPDEEHWERIVCAPFLDPSKTGLLARTIWIPDLPVIPPRYRRHWGEHCLLRRKTP